MKTHAQVLQAVKALAAITRQQPNRKLQMPGDGRYQPNDLIPLLGYDQWAGWLIIVEWFWMKVLAKMGVMPREDAKLLTQARLIRLLSEITTTIQDRVEKATKDHDIQALLLLMRERLPVRLRRWVHYCATSYDAVDTAYALQIKLVFELVFLPQLREVDQLWRDHIAEHAETPMLGWTHLQPALPLTVGCWLGQIHNRWVRMARQAWHASQEVEGKFSGAVGTSASQIALIGQVGGEWRLMRMLGLPVAEFSTQIVSPENRANFYWSLVLLSGAMANLGEDGRILQSPVFGLVRSASSGSSAITGKTSNPIAAENDAGMHETVKAEFERVKNTLVSDLQRDLRWSNVMRGFSAVMVYTYQQILTTAKLLKSLKVDTAACNSIFQRFGTLSGAEALHLALQREGVPDAHGIVNARIVAQPKACQEDLIGAMEMYVGTPGGDIPHEVWQRVKNNDAIRAAVLSPDRCYLGNAVDLAMQEAVNAL